jgi:hypothetical protein
MESHVNTVVWHVINDNTEKFWFERNLASLILEEE